MMKRCTLLFMIVLLTLTSCSASRSAQKVAGDSEELVYLHHIKSDFLAHREDMVTITTIAENIRKRIDSLLNGERKDSSNADLVKGIMTTRPYQLTILAYKEILNGNYVHDAKLKLAIASHVNRFEGIAQSKRSWDEQWDKTARPFLYSHGLFLSRSTATNLIGEPLWRSILYDRRMFAHDAEIYSPGLLAEIDAIIGMIDTRLQQLSPKPSE